MDAGAVSAAQTASEDGAGRARTFRIAAIFGIFQAAMALAGWAGGLGLNQVLAEWDHWIAFALLTTFGSRMVVTSNRAGPTSATLTTRALIVLAFATSIDSLAVGLTLPLLQVEPILAVTVIGLVTFIICLISGSIGQRLGAKFGRRAGIAGGMVLIGIGTHILIRHLSA